MRAQGGQKMEILMQEERIIALLHGPDRAGIVARVSGWIYARGGNILHADQHRDRQEGIFSSAWNGFR